ncbi:anthrone oxygenase family protein [Streptomyces sp. NPDC002120]|uniref:anthrone oxygenase family protein n=1 Tax=Streptomyces sp. NPDC002120 TaxID=3364631 RepID=UPI0036AC5C55
MSSTPSEAAGYARSEALPARTHVHVPEPTHRRVRVLQALALLATGLLAGAFGYGAANLVPTFNAVPLDMRLSFHAELMKMNGITMQAAMAVSTLSTLALAALTRGRARLIAGAAGLLTLASFLITRLGNVPINGRIKEWALSSAPADHAEILRRWELFNNLRTLTALTAFVLLIALALTGGYPQVRGYEARP